MPASADLASCIALVVGAGPVGLTMALELSRHGVPCRIVDSAPQPNDKSKALVLWGRTLELLDPSGSVADDFLPQGVPARAVSIYGNGRRLVHMPFQREDTAFAEPLMIPQCDTERLLAARLATRGIEIERGVELTEFVDCGSSVLATLRHPGGTAEQVRCQWLLGCDGAHSVVRKELGIEFTGEFDPNDWILADAHLDGPLDHDELSIHWHAAGIVALFPIGRDRFRVVADQGHAAGAAKPADPSLQDVQTILDNRGLQALRIHTPIWLAGFRIHERKVAQYGIGRVFLAGDAAHIHSPAGGQGMNTGMQDAVNLAWKLALVQRGRGLRDTLLASYTEERSAVGNMVLRGATHLTRLATLRNPLLQFIRNRAFALVGSLSAVQHRAIASLSEMAVSYPHSSLTADDPGKAFCHEVQSGDRLPDAEVLELGHAQPQRLLTTLRGTSHHLLLFPESDDPTQITPLLSSAREACQSYGETIELTLILREESSGAGAAAAVFASAATAARRDIRIVCDISGRVRHRLGVRHQAMVLIRPDGYISFRGHAGSWARLEAHLAMFLFPSAERTGRQEMKAL